MTFGAKPAAVQHQARVTMVGVGSMIRYSTAAWGSANGSATPEFTRNGRAGIFCRGALCVMIGYDAGLGNSYIYVSLATMPNDVIGSPTFLKGVIINGTRYALPSGTLPGGDSLRYTVSGDAWGLAGASFPIRVEFY